MSLDTTYTNLRENLSSILDQVVADQEIIFIKRKGVREVALIPAEELAGLIETAHLLRSPKNARRLLSSLDRAQSGKPKRSSVDQLRREVLGDKGL